MSTTDHQIKDIILNLNKPYVIKKFPAIISWKCFNISFEEWINSLDAHNNSSDINFDTGSKIESLNKPQWEYCRETKLMKCSEFFSKYKDADNNSNNNIWASYGYKSIEILPDNCKEGISFAEFGFNDIDTNDISFWLGSKDAHTPCHYDSYGCNIVVQVYGRKSWLLFPQTSKMLPTRVPYEESSIYSKINFFSPSNLKQFEDISHDAFNVILEPGDILIVPTKWWHYVENLELSLAINTWIKLDSDLEAQLEECFVKMQVSQLTMHLNDEIKSALINPNELSNLYDTPLKDQLTLLDNLASIINDSDRRTKMNLNFNSINYLNENELKELIIKYKLQLLPVDKLVENNFYQLMNRNAKRYNNESRTINHIQMIEHEDDFKMYSSMINSICNPNAVRQFKLNYLNERKV